MKNPWPGSTSTGCLGDAVACASRGRGGVGVAVVAVPAAQNRPMRLGSIIISKIVITDDPC